MDDKIIQTKSMGVTYRGDVSVKLVRNKDTVRQVKTHNTGTLSLFKYIGLAMMGDVSAYQHMPNFIHTYFWDSSTASSDYMFDNSTCIMNVPVSTKDIYIDSNKGVARIELTFLIPYSQIWGQTNILALYGTTGFNYSENGVTVNDKEPLAYVDLGDDIIDVDVDSTNVLVDWTITIRNDEEAV